MFKPANSSLQNKTLICLYFWFLPGGQDWYDIQYKILILSASALSVVKVKLLSEMSNKPLFTGAGMSLFLMDPPRGSDLWTTLTLVESSTRRKPGESYPDWTGASWREGWVCPRTKFRKSSTERRKGANENTAISNQESSTTKFS